MWKILKAILLRWLLAVLVPLGALLKALGVPLLVALILLGLPVLLLLALIGVPFPLAALAAAGLTVFVGVLLALGWALIKIVLPIVLIVWFIRWAFFDDRDKRGKGAEPGPDMV